MNIRMYCLKVMSTAFLLVCNMNISTYCLKVVSTTFLLVCFLSLKKSICETRKMFLISLQKLFSFSRKSNFRISDIQVCWHCQMPKHITRSTFYWLNWEENFVLMKFDQFMPSYKRNYFSKNFTKTATWKHVPGLFVFARIDHNLYWKIELLKQAT